MTKEEAKQQNTQSKVSQPDRESEGLKTFINKFCGFIVNKLNTKLIQEKTIMTNTEEMKSAQAQSQIDQPPQPPKPPEIPTTPEKAISLFKRIKQGVIGEKEEAPIWGFQFEQPPNLDKPSVPNPKTKFSEPVVVVQRNSNNQR
jgi:hypothetical protein